MLTRAPLLVWILGWTLVACGTEPGALESGPEAVGPADVAGRWDVEGVTVDKKSGEQRPIEGRITLVQDAARYTAHFQLNTHFPGSEEAHSAQVVGTGEGVVEGRTLRGTADTNLVQATVPGVDVDFAFIPRSVSRRIVSTSVATVEADGSIRIEIDNEPAAGEEYSPTRTTLTGHRSRRTGAAGSAPGPPGAEGAR